MMGWSESDMTRLKQLVLSGASVRKCAVVLSKPVLFVRNQARILGTPFPDAAPVALKYQIFSERKNDHQILAESRWR